MFRPPKFEKKLGEDGLYWYHFDEEWDRKRVMQGNRIILLTLLILIISLALLGTYVYKNTEALKANPLVYAANEIEGLWCSCTNLNADGSTGSFSFDKDGIEIMKY